MGKANPEAVKLARDFKEKAGKKYGIDKVVLFGSQATGKTREGSDIDLLVVSEKSKDKAEFMSELLKEWHINQEKESPVDFVCFTRGEFSRLSRKITIVKQALEEGVEI